VTIPRYSREDMAAQVSLLVALRDLGLHQAELEPVGRSGRRSIAPEPYCRVEVRQVRLWAAMMSEAANRTPTHAELVEMIDAATHAEQGREP
jgi:hypothetical protein